MTFCEGNLDLLCSKGNIPAKEKIKEQNKPYHLKAI
jgi:hypothetical protein